MRPPVRLSNASWCDPDLEHFADQLESADVNAKTACALFDRVAAPSHQMSSTLLAALDKWFRSCLRAPRSDWQPLFCDHQEVLVQFFAFSEARTMCGFSRLPRRGPAMPLFRRCQRSAARFPPLVTTRTTSTPSVGTSSPSQWIGWTLRACRPRKRSRKGYKASGNVSLLPKNTWNK